MITLQTIRDDLNEIRYYYSRKDVFDKGIGGFSVSRLNHLIENRVVEIARANDDDRNGENGNEHQKPLHEIGPADGLIAAEEGINKNDSSEDEHSGSLVKRGENACKYACTCNKRGCNIDGETNKEDKSRNYLQSLVSATKPV